MGKNSDSIINLFLCGDVMLGRGIDQIFPYPSTPILHEPQINNAQDYVRLAEEKNGHIPKPSDFSYVWGDALSWFKRINPDVKIINLETSITKSEDYWRGKSIHYRMNPLNIQSLTSAKIDCCTLANNHIMDWGYSGLEETVTTLSKAKIQSCGAGENILKAERSAVLDVEKKGRVLVFSLGLKSSGIPLDWRALNDKAGVNLIPELSNKDFHNLAKKIQENKQDEDLVVVSIHWGGNWDYNVSINQKKFAHMLIDDAGVDVVHGHSAHHVKGFEVYKKKLILYGCGDFLNDYEGIVPFSRSNHRFIKLLKSHNFSRRLIKKFSLFLDHQSTFRRDLCLMYFVSVEVGSGVCLSLDMVPMKIKRFRINNSSQVEMKLMKKLLEREEGSKCGVELKNGIISLSRKRLNSSN